VVDYSSFFRSTESLDSTPDKIDNWDLRKDSKNQTLDRMAQTGVLAKQFVTEHGRLNQLKALKTATRG
jgi:hypothetical protein